MILFAQLGEDFFGDREGAAQKCPGNNELCPGWIADNFDQYLDPLWDHVLLSVVPLAIGFVVATGLALLAHRYTYLNGFFLAFVSILFTIPSIAFYLILLNVTGRGYATAVVVLTAYTLVLIYRNVATGLQGERVREELRSPADPIVELDDILRDALSDLLSADSQYGPVVDADGCVAGVLSIEALSHALTIPAEQVPSATELATEA